MQVGNFLPLCGISGVKNADENELKSIASDPDDIHMYNVADFSFLLDIVERLTDNLCNSVKGSGILIRIFIYFTKFFISCLSTHHFD